MGGTALPRHPQDAPRSLPADGTAASSESRAPAAEEAARRSLREQIARLESQLADAFVTAFPMGGLPDAAGTGERSTAATAGPGRLLGLGELERVRDDLVERLREARAAISARAAEQEEKRVLLERMLLAPGDYRFTRISCRELGEPGCGVWQVRPRLGLIGMLMGWWQVTLSSGCPLPGGRCAPC